MLVSDEILAEYQRVGQILAENFPTVDLRPFIELLATDTEIVRAEKLKHPVCDDPDDDKFLACALAGKSKIIISGDKHLLRVSGYKEIIVLRPRKFLEDYLKL